ncbi:hypothetical protein EON82_06570 [bacterium]|nr:MAG: hypothetical protein EON82_06570 [bacterium]
MPLALLTFALLAEVTLRPSADIWVYPHAGDPAKDGYLRVWGREGRAVAKLIGDAAEFSYSLLRFDPKDLPEGKLTKATLVLTLVADPVFSEEQSKRFPLQARPVDGAFEEKGWKYDLLERFNPTFDEKSVYGTAFPSPWPETGKEGMVEIDLLKGPGDFRAALDRAKKDAKPLGIALTSTLDVQTNPDAMTIYKLYSKDAPLETLRPRLVLTFE